MKDSIISISHHCDAVHCQQAVPGAMALDVGLEGYKTYVEVRQPYAGTFRMHGELLPGW